MSTQPTLYLQFIERATQRIFAILMDHKEGMTEPTNIGPPDLYLQEEGNTLTYLSNDLNGPSTMITQEEGKKIIEEWIIDSLTKHNYLYIYTCRDNVEVVLEDIENLKKDEPEIFDIYDLEFEIPEENPIYKLYIAYD